MCDPIFMTSTSLTCDPGHKVCCRLVPPVRQGNPDRLLSHPPILLRLTHDVLQPGQQRGQVSGALGTDTPLQVVPEPGAGRVAVLQR